MRKYLLVLVSCVLAVLNLILVFFIFDNNVCIINKGVAFGIDLGFENGVLLVLLVVLMLVYIKSRDGLRYNILAISILGLGNFVERILRGYICDYLHIFSISVNLTDIGITAIVVFSLIYLFRNIYADKSRRGKKQEIG